MRRFYLIFVPLIALLLSSLIQAQQTQPCPPDYEGYLPPRLQLGGQGRVMEGGSPNRVRLSPMVNTTQTGELPPETVFDIIGGPSCNPQDEIIWWQVKTDEIEGWTAEGLLPDDYFLEPYGEPVQATWTPIPTRTPVPSPTPTITRTPLPVSPLPELETLSPDNLSQLEVLANFHGSGSDLPPFTSPDGSHLFIKQGRTFGGDPAIVYRLPDFQQLNENPIIRSDTVYYANAVSLTKFTPDGDLMVSVSPSGRIYLYQPDEDQLSVEEMIRNGYTTVRRFDLSVEGVLAIEVGESNQESGATDDVLYLRGDYGQQDAVAGYRHILLNARLSDLKFTSDGSQLIAATENSLTVYNVSNGSVENRFNYGVVPDGVIAVLPTSDREGELPTVFLSQQDYILSIDLETGAQRTYPIGVGYHAAAISFSPDGENMLVFADDDTLYMNAMVLNIETKENLYTVEMRQPLDSVEYHKSGSLLRVGIWFFDTTTWEQVYNLGDNYVQIEFTDDGKMISAYNLDAGVYQLLGVPSR
jgi:WD40 repeat protein